MPHFSSFRCTPSTASARASRWTEFGVPDALVGVHRHRADPPDGRQRLVVAGPGRLFEPGYVEQGEPPQCVGRLAGRPGAVGVDDEAGRPSGRGADRGAPVGVETWLRLADPHLDPTEPGVHGRRRAGGGLLGRAETDLRVRRDRLDGRAAEVLTERDAFLAGPRVMPCDIEAHRGQSRTPEQAG